MTERILDILKSEKIEKYSIYQERRESSELFFVRKKLELVRGKDTVDVKLTVYREFDKEGKHCLGSSEVFIYPETDDEQIKELIKSAYASALYADNPYYELPEPEKPVGAGEESTIKSCVGGSFAGEQETAGKLSDNAIAMAKALYAPDTDDDSWINSAEIFAKRNTVRIINCNGCDVSYIKESICGEFVVQSRLCGNDVELFRQFEYDGVNADALSEKCRDALRTVKDRAAAVKAPEDVNGYPVILCDETVGEFLGFYLSRCNASYIYPGYSDYKIEKPVCQDVSGDKLSLLIVPDVPYSSEGIKKNVHKLIDEGIVKTFHGGSAYSSYVGIRPIGEYTRIVCENEGADDEKFFAEPYIMVKNFSDFQMDAMDGSFGGEFRLAYLCENGKKTALTGGTVSGNIFDAQKKLIFSKKRYEEASYTGPAMVRIG